jgi:hypothetical protein
MPVTRTARAATCGDIRPPTVERAGFASAAIRAIARPCPAAAPTRCSTRSTGRADDTRAGLCRPRRPLFHDGRQSRRQPRQPLQPRAGGRRAGADRPSSAGRALVAFWSTDGSAEWLKPWTWFTARAGTGSADLSMDQERLARDEARPPPAPTQMFERALTHSAATAATAMSGSNSSATGCSAWSSRRWLYERFPDEPEGKMSPRYNALVARETCAEVGRELGLRATSGSASRRARTAPRSATMSSATSSRR